MKTGDIVYSLRSRDNQYYIVQGTIVKTRGVFYVVSDQSSDPRYVHNCRPQIECYDNKTATGERFQPFLWHTTKEKPIELYIAYSNKKHEEEIKKLKELLT